MKLFLAAILSIFAIFPQLGFAETMPASSSSGYTVGGLFGVTGQDACQAYWNSGARYGASSLGPANMTTMRCTAYYGADLSTNWAVIVAGSGYNCPANQNWTLQGSNCTRPDCTAGQTRNEQGVCVAGCPSFPGDSNTPLTQPSTCSCPANSQWVPGAGCRNTCNNSANVGAPTFNSVEFPSGKDEACMNGCVVQATAGEYLQYRDGSRLSKATQTNWACSTTGAPGTSPTVQPEAVRVPDANVKPPACAAGEGVLTSSSGNVRCLPAGTPATRIPETRRSETKTDYPDGSQRIVVNIITRDPGTGAQHLSTITTITAATGGGAGQAGTPGTVNSGTGGDGNGDDKDPCLTDPERLGCKKLDTPPQEGAIDTTTKGVTSITVTPFASAAQCPANVALPKGATFKWEPICDLATGVKPILIALAWLSAGLIVMGAFKE